MNGIQRWTLTMLQDALTTANHNPPASPPTDFTVITGELSTVITQIAAAAVAQSADRGSARAAVQAARQALFNNYLVPIRTIALGRLPSVENVDQLFALPARTAHKATVLKDAQIIATHAAQYKDTFIASGQPADFIDQLNTAITAFEQSGANHTAARGDQQKATQQLQTLITQGKQLVHGLNGIMQVAFAKNTDVLAAWNSARRIRRKHVTSTKSSATSSTAIATTTTSPSTPQATAPATTQVTPQASSPTTAAIHLVSPTPAATTTVTTEATPVTPSTVTDTPHALAA